MFKKMKEIDVAFKHVRAFTIVIIIACVALTTFSLYKSHLLVSEMQSKVYILANGKAMEAFSVGTKDNIPVEARDHIKTFHELFFTLDPDDKAIQSTVSKAFNLADNSVKRVYDNLRENDFYAGIISGNINQTIEVDSVIVDINEYPYRFRCFATQQIVRPTTVTTRSLVTEGALRTVSRSDNNPHGFLIEKWNTIENNDLKTENRR